MSGALRLLKIETRRNVGPWFVPLILAFAWWLLGARGWTPIFWQETNALLQEVVVGLAAPAFAGAAAWMAGRGRRRGLDDLLASTAYPATARRAALITATALWGLLAYGIVAAFTLTWSALVATWDGPRLWPIAVVALAILAHAAWGALIGEALPSRFTAPLVAIGALTVQLVLGNWRMQLGGGMSSDAWISYLAAHKWSYHQSPWQALLYGSLLAAAIAAGAVRARRGPARWAVLAATAALAVAGVVMIWGESPRPFNRAVGVPYNNFGRPMALPNYYPPAPACAGSPVVVCLHPRFQPVLREAVTAANALAEPFLGLPGVPLRAEDGDISVRWGGSSPSWLHVARPVQLDLSQSRFADDLVADPATQQHGTIVNEAQLAMRTWLLERIGGDSRCSEPLPQYVGADGPPGWPSPAACDAAARFGRLAPAGQRAWLEAHYADLRAGRLKLEDLS